jgi:hypothetical protein
MPPRRNPTTGPNTLEIGEESVHPELVDIPTDEATLLGSQVMDAIDQLVSTFDVNLNDMPLRPNNNIGI